MRKLFISQFIIDCIHMISTRKLRYDDIGTDAPHTIFIMDCYDEKIIYQGMDTHRLYFDNEDIIHFILTKHFNRIFDRR